MGCYGGDVQEVEDGRRVKGLNRVLGVKALNAVFSCVDINIKVE